MPHCLDKSSPETYAGRYSTRTPDCEINNLIVPQDACCFKCAIFDSSKNRGVQLSTRINLLSGKWKSRNIIVSFELFLKTLWAAFNERGWLRGLVSTRSCTSMWNRISYYLRSSKTSYDHAACRNSLTCTVSHTKRWWVSHKLAYVHRCPHETRLVRNSTRWEDTTADNTLALRRRPQCSTGSNRNITSMPLYTIMQRTVCCK